MYDLEKQMFHLSVYKTTDVDSYVLTVNGIERQNVTQHVVVCELVDAIAKVVGKDEAGYRGAIAYLSNIAEKQARVRITWDSRNLKPDEK